MQDITLIRNFGRDANAERGARFHPTIGSVTPNGFTTSHPRARPRCLRFNFLLPAQWKSRMKVTLLLLYSELLVFLEFLQFFPTIPVARVLSLFSPLLPHFLSCLFSARLCVARISPSAVRSGSYYEWVVHPHPLINS
jgi:hypothetical protein